MIAGPHGIYLTEMSVRYQSTGSNRVAVVLRVGKLQHESGDREQNLEARAAIKRRIYVVGRLRRMTMTR
jgi:hypothetical protein